MYEAGCIAEEKQPPKTEACESKYHEFFFKLKTKTSDIFHIK